jgi:hypothetical protein
MIQRDRTAETIERQQIHTFAVLGAVKTPLVCFKTRYRYRHSILVGLMNLSTSVHEDGRDVEVFFQILDFCALSAVLGDIGGSGGIVSFERSALRSLPL